MGRIVVGYTADGEPVTAEQLKAAGAMTVIMRDAIKPNLLQTLENTPVLVHAGPFGNIAHGNSSVVADLIGIHAGEYLVTEAGFGADMGAERFFNIKCRISGLVPDAAVVVTTVRAMKLHSGRHRVVAGRPLPPAMLEENPEEVQLGAANLLAHLAIVRRHGVTPVVAINAIEGDFPSEHAAIREIAASVGVRAAVCTHFEKGGKGAVELAEAVVEATAEPSRFHMLYPDEAPLREKIEAVATEVYGADGVDYQPLAASQLDTLRAGRLRHAARLHRQDPPLHLVGPHTRGRPPGLAPARARGAGQRRVPGSSICVSGDMRTMPGLSHSPAAERIDIDERRQRGRPLLRPRRPGRRTWPSTSPSPPSTRRSAPASGPSSRTRCSRAVKGFDDEDEGDLAPRVPRHDPGAARGGQGGRPVAAPHAQGVGRHGARARGAGHGAGRGRQDAPRARGSSTAWRRTRATCTRSCTGAPTSRRTTTSAGCATAPPCRASP